MFIKWLPPCRLVNVEGHLSQTEFRCGDPQRNGCLDWGRFSKKSVSVSVLEPHIVIYPIHTIMKQSDPV